MFWIPQAKLLLEADMGTHQMVVIMDLLSICIH